MQAARRLRSIGLIAGLLLLAAIAGAKPPVLADDPARARLRSQALEDIRSPDPAERARACAVLGDVGRNDDLPRLLAALHDAAAPVREAAEQAVWRIWSRSGDPATDRLFEQGLAQMQGGDLRGAVATFDEVIRMNPDFAEGWNKRATVYFLLGEDDRSLRDCDEVIKRNPAHFGVLAGYGQLYLRKHDLPTALEYFERALAINPNMSGVRASIEAIERTLAQERKRFI